MLHCNLNSFNIIFAYVLTFAILYKVKSISVKVCR